MVVVAFIFSSNCPLFRIASNPYSSGWNNFARNLGQRSEVLNLTEGEDYLLVGELKEAGGGDYIQVSPLSVCLSVCLAACLSVWLSVYVLFREWYMQFIRQTYSICSCCRLVC